jgi:hypothetical protein
MLASHLSGSGSSGGANGAEYNAACISALEIARTALSFSSTALTMELYIRALSLGLRRLGWEGG